MLWRKVCNIRVCTKLQWSHLKLLNITQMYQQSKIMKSCQKDIKWKSSLRKLSMFHRTLLVSLWNKCKNAILIMFPVPLPRSARVVLVPDWLNEISRAVVLSHNCLNGSLTSKICYIKWNWVKIKFQENIAPYFISHTGASSDILLFPYS